MADPLFRKAALDKLASPERLDILMQVTPPQQRIARWTIVALLVAGVGWGVFGSVADRIPGQGQLQAGGGTQQIVSAGDGLLTTLTLAENGSVAEGQLVATISSVGIEQNSNAAQARYDEAQRLAATTRSIESSQISDLEAQQRVVAGQVQDQKLALEKKQPFVDRGDLAPRELEPIRRQIEALESRSTDLGIQIAARRSTIASAESAVKQARIELDQTKNTSAEVSQLKSAISGRVTHVYRQAGDRVTKGEVLADVEVASKTSGLEVVAFVPASFGQRVAVGHAVQITVAGVRREEAGFLKGTVTFVSDALVSADRVAALTKEKTTEGASYELRIAPTPDPSTISGYAWSTGKGPPQTFTGAVPVTIAVEVGERTPIRQFVPWLRGLFGI